MTSLDDAADALPAPDDILGLPMDPSWREVDRYLPTAEDGHEVVVSVARMPAKFWRIECPDLELDLRTGSGMHELADSIAGAISDGMLGVGDDP
jgi:hypothetical protein